MNLACCTWALSGADTHILDQIADMGCGWIDIRPADFTADASLAHMRSRSLRVSCVGLSFGIPARCSLDDGDAAAAAQGVAHGTRALDRAAALGAQTTYVVPSFDDDPAALQRFGASLRILADRAAEHGIKLCVEHFPGRALPTIGGTLAYLDALDHPNLHLLLDIGHAQMTDEPIPDAIAAATAAGRLGYVHFDDNDGENDLHWALLDGVLTPDMLRDTFTALREHGYSGNVSLELSPQLPDPADAVRRSWAVMKEAMG